MTLLDDDCAHPGWCKERTHAGFIVCRVCHPRENKHDPMFA